MKDQFSQSEIQSYGLSLHAMNSISGTLFPAMLKDAKLYDQFEKDPVKVLAEYGIEVPEGLKINTIKTQKSTATLFLPPKETLAYLEELNEGLSALSFGASEPYVQVEAKWWGLVFILSNQAAKDLATGQGGITAVLGGLTAILGILPPPANALALFPGILAAILGLHAAAIGLMNRGNGVYITALWPLILDPLKWIPTPR
jgi:hypothetical protein